MLSHGVILRPLGSQKEFNTHCFDNDTITTVHMGT